MFISMCVLYIDDGDDRDDITASGVLPEKKKMKFSIDFLSDTELQGITCAYITRTFYIQYKMPEVI